MQQGLADEAEQQAGETTASPGVDDDQLGVAAGVERGRADPGTLQPTSWWSGWR
nr:hypothetical protein [Streptomyces sp. rh34]